MIKEQDDFEPNLGALTNVRKKWNKFLLFHGIL